MLMDSKMMTRSSMTALKWKREGYNSKNNSSNISIRNNHRISTDECLGIQGKNSKHLTLRCQLRTRQL